MRKGTSEEGTERGRDGAREREEGGTNGGGSDEGGNGAKVGAREERVRNGASERGKFQGRYPVEDTGQYTVYSIQRTNQPTTRPLPLRLGCYK